MLALTAVLESLLQLLHTRDPSLRCHEAIHVNRNISDPTIADFQEAL